MAVKIKVDITAFEKAVKMYMEDMKNKTLRAIRQSCYEAVIYAKSLNTYQDQTTHLRSSIGFQTYKDGQLVDSWFEGAEAGTSAGRRVSGNFKSSSAIYAVMVAGEHYATYVEAKGFDVLTGATYRLQEFLNKNLAIEFEGTGVDFKVK